MSLAIAYPALVLPLILGPRRVSGTALVIGSLTPDLLYPLTVVPSATVQGWAWTWGGRMHMLPQGVAFGVLLALFAFVVFQYLLRPTIVTLLPPAFRARLHGDAARPGWGNKPLVVVLDGLFAGVLIHVLWDLLTHYPWMLPFPLASLHTGGLVDVGLLPIFRHFDYLGTLLGAVALLWAITRWFQGASPEAARQAWQARRQYVLAGCLILPAALAPLVPVLLWGGWSSGMVMASTLLNFWGLLFLVLLLVLAGVDGLGRLVRAAAVARRTQGSP